MATVIGDDNHNKLDGTSGNDAIYGLEGNDQLYGYNGNDTLYGGTDTNTLYGGAGNDIFKMSARFYYDADYGGYGDYGTRLDIIADFQTGDRIDVSAYGISSFDQLKLIFETKSGTDAYFNAYYGGLEHAVRFTKVAASKLTASDFVFNTQGAKNEAGTDAADRLFGTVYNDTLNGLEGDDQLFGGNGNDTLLGGTDTNTLYGGAGNDIFKMSARFYYDSEYGGYGDYGTRLDIIADFQTGDKINVSAYGISSFDQLKLIFETKSGTDAYFNAYYGGLEHAVRFTKVAASKLTASDFIFDTQGAKDEAGTDAADRLFGSTASDTLNGLEGDDQLFGGNGNDTLLGGTDTNTLYGGAGNDTFTMWTRFYYDDEYGGYGDYGTRLDIIADFQTGDKIDVSAYGISSFDQLKLIFETKNSTDGYFNAYYGGLDHAVRFTKVAASKLVAADFIFDTQGAKDESGTDAADRLFGSTAGDTLNGLEGNDQLFGGNGNDTLYGGTDTNTLYGGAGNDIFTMWTRFYYDDEYGGYGDYGTRLDVIGDFQTGDKVDVSAYGISSFDQLKLILTTKNSTDAYFNAYYAGLDHAVQFTKVDISKLKATDFIYDTTLNKDESGTDSADRLFGSTAGDTLDGLEGNDQLFGGNGNDTLTGGTDTNTLYGGAGNDIFKMWARFYYDDEYGGYGDYGTRLDVIGDFQTGDRIDVSAYGISSFDQLKLIFTTKNGTDAYFNAYYGGQDHAVQFTKVDISKLKAADFIYDTTLNKDETGTDGTDRLFGSASGDTLDGLEGNDQLFGGSGNDTLHGGDGEDWLYGQTGNDTMIGGYDDDVYFVTDSGDIVDESTGDGIDEVRSTISLSITSSSRVLGTVENLTLLGSAAIKGTGNSLANIITGNTGDNSLDGKAGADRLIGGKGNDTYIVDNAGDKVVENASEGTDLVKAAVSYTLATNVENLTLIGSASINGVGNSLANIITGNARNNKLDGKAGADTLAGGQGHDTYTVDNAGDKIVEKAGEGTDLVYASVSYTLATNVEKLTLTGYSALDGTGNSLANTITGNSANNILDGKAGADALVGGWGSDTYIVDNAGDKVIEKANEGTDLVKASVSHTLATNVENLTLTGTAAINGVGNSLANTITGNTGNNVLNGGQGNDLLSGGLGKDTFLFNTALNASSNVDRIADFVAVDDVIYLENAIFKALTTTGTLAASAFIANTAGAATDSKDRIIYETDTGRLFYDADGTGSAAKIHFATLDGKPAISASDFFIV